MCKKIIALSLVIGLMQIAGFNRNSFAEEKIVKEEIAKNPQDLKTLRVEEKIRAMQEKGIESQEGTVYHSNSR
ncbi:MAG: hypothetical protein QME42_08720 [bacterium]|nr:hypothetical protein [bacterium]